MKKEFKTIANGIIGGIIGTLMVFAINVATETLIGSEGVSYSNSKTAETTVDGALDELFSAVDINEKIGDMEKISSIGDGTITGALNKVKSINEMSGCEVTITKAAAQTDMQAYTWYTVPFDTLSDNENYSINNGIITIKKSGFYSIKAKVHFGIAPSNSNSTEPSFGLGNLVINGLLVDQNYTFNYNLSTETQQYVMLDFTGYLSANATFYTALVQSKNQVGGLYGKESYNSIWVTRLHD